MTKNQAAAVVTVITAVTVSVVTIIAALEPLFCRGGA